MSKNYLTIKEFAKRAGVSPQYIYKLINNQTDNSLTTSLKVENGKKYLNISALSMFIQEESSKPVEQPIDNSLTTSLNATIDALTKQLEIKDNQLLAQSEQIASLIKLNENQQVLLKNEQEKLLMIESGHKPKKWGLFKNKND
jgi:transcriptional regulator with XRE-family HTH domain